MDKNKTTGQTIVVAGYLAISDQLRDELSSAQFEIRDFSEVENGLNPEDFGNVDLILVADTMISEISKLRQFFPLAEFLLLSDSNLPSQLIPQAVLLPTNSTPAVIMQMIKVAIRNAVTTRENLTLKTNIAMSFGFDNLAGNSQAMNKIKEIVTRLAPTDITLLLTGPGGCGKRLVASIVHFHSRRRRLPMVTVDFANANEQQLTQELFGDQHNPGALTQAHMGTLFLKNICQAPTNIQDLLVEFMRTRQIKGQSGQVLTLDTRVIVSSYSDLEAMIIEGTFHPDLWHLINEMPIAIPSLNDHKDDLEALVEYFIQRSNRNLKISTASMEKLRNYSWPGDIRELETVLQRAASVCHDNLINVDDIPGLESTSKQLPPRNTNPATTRNGGRLADGQRSIIEKALDENDWNFTQTANELGIGRTTLWRKVKKYNLERGEYVKELRIDK